MGYMAALAPMPIINVDSNVLAEFGARWRANGERLGRRPQLSSIELGNFFDRAVANALSEMLGNVPVVRGNATSLVSPLPDCVELGPFRVVGGVRPQNFDVGYRPDGVRFAFDSKTLNDADSVRKNYQNMINDIATEATTVHTRFPYAIVAFLIAIPSPCLAEPQRSALIGTLMRLTGRAGIDSPGHLAEAISLVVWNPDTGETGNATPDDATASVLRIENFSSQVEKVYTSRYQGLPPHTG